MRRIAIAATALCLTSTAWSLTFTPPEETTPAGLSGDKAELVRSNCMGCHSLDYIATQPRKDAAFWKGTVAKMMTVYGAPVDPADGEKIAAILTATYGARQ
ncbi:sulfite:cytochrome C oxidoreductase subunit B [soil metagenome]